MSVSEGSELQSQHTEPSLPPGPRGLPVLGNLHSLTDAIGFMERCARDHGDIAGMNLAGWPAVLVNRTDAIEQILVKDHEKFGKNSHFWRHVTAIFGTGMLTSEGPMWRRQRKAASPPFAPAQVDRYIDDMAGLATRSLDRWHTGEVFDVHPEMMALTLRIAAKSLFESEVEADIERMEVALDDMVVEVAARFKRPMLIPDWVPLPGHLRYRSGIKVVEKVIAKAVTERRRVGSMGSDFLSRMLAATDASGAPLSEKQVRDEAVTMILAGHETTALALSWALYLLGSHADVQEAAAAEVRQVLGDRPPKASDLPSLKLTEAALTEAMRLYPPGWIIGRESLKDVQVGPYLLPKGTTIFISPWILHRNPAYFEDPLEYRPDRWLNGLERELPRFAYMPFGGGPRVCIGQRFAIVEALVILARILQRFRIVWRGENPPTPFPSITLRPDGGVFIDLEER